MTPAQLLPRLEEFEPAENTYAVRSRAGSGPAPFNLVTEPLLRHPGLVSANGTVSVTVKTKAGAVQNYALPLVPHAVMAPSPRRPWIGWHLDAVHSLGVLYVDEMADPADYWKPVDELFFAAVEANGIQRIALDLRENPGGSLLVVNAILQHLPASKRFYTLWIRGDKQGYEFPTLSYHSR